MKILPVIGFTLLSSTWLVAAPPEGSGRESSGGPVVEEVKRLLADGQTAFSKGDYPTAKGAFETAYQIGSRNMVAIHFLQKIKTLAKSVPKYRRQERRATKSRICPVPRSLSFLEVLSSSRVIGRDEGGSWPGALVRSKGKSQVPDETPRGKPLAERAGDIVPVRCSAVGPWMKAEVVTPVKPAKSDRR